MAQPHTPTARSTTSPRDAIFANAQRLIVAANQKRSALDADGFTDEERAGGDLLDALALELRSALTAADKNIHIGDEPNRFVLTKDGRWLRAEAGQWWPVRSSARLMRVEPDIRAILNDIDACLIEANHPACTAGAMLVREVRDVLEKALAGPT